MNCVFFFPCSGTFPSFLFFSLERSSSSSIILHYHITTVPSRLSSSFLPLCPPFSLCTDVCLSLHVLFPWWVWCHFFSSKFLCNYFILHTLPEVYVKSDFWWCLFVCACFTEYLKATEVFSICLLGTLTHFQWDMWLKIQIPNRLNNVEDKSEKQFVVWGFYTTMWMWNSTAKIVQYFIWALLIWFTNRTGCKHESQSGTELTGLILLEEKASYMATLNLMCYCISTARDSALLSVHNEIVHGLCWI